MAIQNRTNALQNEIVRLYCDFFNEGRLANPASQPLVEILDADGVNVLATLSPTIEFTGRFYADWFIPANLPLGTYYDRWTFQWQNTGGVKELTFTFEVFSLDSYINFISPANSHFYPSRVYQLMQDLSNEFIYEAMHIPVYFEQGMKIQQDNQQKRIKGYYYFTLDSDSYNVSEDAVYFHNSQRYTVTQSLTPYYSSSSSESSESIYSVSSVSDSLSSSSLSSQSSSSSESEGNSSTSTSSAEIVTTTTTTEWGYKPILTCAGTGYPLSSGVLSKIKGSGPDTITFTSYTAKISRFSTIYSVAYPNWNKDPRPLVRINTRLVDDGWTTDWNGKIYFDGLMAPEDNINIAYNFRYFSEEEILSFLQLGLQMMNTTPPASTAYNSLSSMPFVWNAPVVLYAAITALKRLIFGLNFQEKYVIFSRPDSPESTDKVIQNFKDLLTSYTEIWNETKKNVKTLKLPSIAMAVTPEYTLPGGRCLSSGTYIKCRINRTKEKILAAKDIFELLKSRNFIEVMSMFENSYLDYTPIKLMWKSGKKITYNIPTRKNNCKLSSEHLVYDASQETYKPVKNFIKGDAIYSSNNNKLSRQIVTGKPYPIDYEDVYDLEIPKTGNLIADEIVSHNSRWFRYLFKSN